MSDPPPVLRWDRLLSAERIPLPGEEADAASARSGDAHRTPFEADHDRVVYAAPFRRLARKTQVHPLAPNDQVHNRLTHSIEVASVGRSLGRRLGAFLTGRGDLAREHADDLVWILQAACLAHDLGNPPFGHAGEYALRAFAAKHPADVPGAGTPAAADWALFEGNAQGFRLAARADNPGAGHLRLTCSTLGAIVKYPWAVDDPRAAARGKFNAFHSEKDVFARVVDACGLALPGGRVARHPLSFLAEAADDICYRILDLEDAVEMRIVPEERVRRIFAGFTEADPAAPLSKLRGGVIRALERACWNAFVDGFPAVMAGEREDDLKSSLAGRLPDALAEVKALYGEIFAHRDKVAAELGAYKALGRIVTALARSVDDLTASPGRRFAETDFLTQRTLELAFGRSHVEEHPGRGAFWWSHRVMDFVSGLTDNGARDLSAAIDGHAA
ncbi:dGTP triphosphohydrolase [Phycisphaera mikurensis]|uniref:Putative deoxyguanosinetriphosphate triphosphohydrolase n=1 Tax=Phycisphaera mikurensis (strain NBRC 102666 / KCTC 22515 / FYK2301M01) TaxID=1142394 RepID=I0IA87_PHYMF|nr:dNTP triphosphohydrolase [Phycisphaera mikurensis]MBB6441823.1 dGTPase [Phycisphaera mikurensis]BAM02175.1 putative deoxyguanosinetriphosphate triphosphohydrolase [Phycisphaera mikurensis NBRC 102666]